MIFANMHRVPRRARMLGLSLIELMAALTIGLLLVAGALTVYMQSRNTYRTTDTVARIQEVARYALDIIEPDVRLASYWGMKKGVAAVTDTVTPTDVSQNCGGAGWIGDATKTIEGFNNAWGTGWTCAAPSNRASGTDVLVVRRASAETSAVSNLKIQVQSNRAQATIFKAAAIPGGYAAAPGSETRDLVLNIYYIAAAGGQSALRRRTLRGSTIEDEEVIPGVEDLQIQFGRDANGDGTPDQYVNPGVGTGAIVSARIWLVAAAESDEQGYRNTTNYRYADRNYTVNDKRRRTIFTKTIQIRNAQP